MSDVPFETEVRSGSTGVAPDSARAASAGLVIIRPDDPRYRDLTVGNNWRWVSRPDYVVLPRLTKHVIQAVQEAVQTGRQISVRSGGHCFADFVDNPDVKVIVDMSQMNQVGFDKQREAFLVEAGASLLNVYLKLYKGWGVTIPAGFCYSSGVGGHITGGGYGFLSRAHGIASEQLDAIEVVVVDKSGKARSMVASCDPSDPNRELWWAHTGGGGGNFGIVTRLWFRTPGAAGNDPTQLLSRPPREVLLSAIGLPWSQLDERRFIQMLKNYGSWHERNSSPHSPYRALCSVLMANHQSNPSCGMVTQIDAGVPNADELLEDYLKEVIGDTGVQTHPMIHAVGELGPLPDLHPARRLPWMASVKYLGTSNPTLTNPTQRDAHKSAYMRQSLTEGQIAKIYKHVTRTDYVNPTSHVALLGFAGGMINAVSSSHTASSHRDSVFMMLYQTFWTDSSEDPVNLEWLRGIYSDVYAETGGYPVPNEASDGCYVNCPDPDIMDPTQNRSGVPWYTFYFKENYRRLQQVKAKYDPLNVFRHSQSITLPDK